jgi:hypothetical protein
MVTRRKCFICDTRPATGGIYCHNCYEHIQAEIRRSHESHKAINPERFITYQGKVISMVNLGDGMGKYQASNKPPEKLPKAKTIDLNVFCDGFEREEIKRLKRLVLSLTNDTGLVGVTYEKSKSKGGKAHGDN